MKLGWIWVNLVFIRAYRLLGPDQQTNPLRREIPAISRQLCDRREIAAAWPMQGGQAQPSPPALRPVLSAPIARALVIPWGHAGPSPERTAEAARIGISQRLGYVGHARPGTAQKTLGPLPSNRLDQVAEALSPLPEPTLQGAHRYTEMARRVLDRRMARGQELRDDRSACRHRKSICHYIPSRVWCVRARGKVLTGCVGSFRPLCANATPRLAMA